MLDKRKADLGVFNAFEFGKVLARLMIVCEGKEYRCIQTKIIAGDTFDPSKKGVVNEEFNAIIIVLADNVRDVYDYSDKMILTVAEKMIPVLITYSKDKMEEDLKFARVLGDSKTTMFRQDRNGRNRGYLNDFVYRVLDKQIEEGSVDLDRILIETAEDFLFDQVKRNNKDRPTVKSLF